ncbi:MAG TPA: heterocyst development glycosyltransferase HepC [Coleofasciculaceae cyanobacterium]
MNVFLPYSHECLHEENFVQPNLAKAFLKHWQKDAAGILSHPISCGLTWRQRKLIVDSCPKSQKTAFSSEQQEWLSACLRNSPIKLVKLDLGLGSANLQAWAEAGQRAHKKTFLRLPAVPQRPQKQKPYRWGMKRLLDRIVAALLLVALSPILVGISFLLRMRSSQPVMVRHWCVGERGLLFQSLRFRTASHPLPQSISSLESSAKQTWLTQVEGWLSQLNLDRLPLLLNVLRGEMSLVGPHPVALADAVRVSPELRHGLNALPGIVGIRPHLTQLKIKGQNVIHPCDVNYIQRWSLRWDLKFLLMTLPKLISTVGIS